MRDAEGRQKAPVDVETQPILSDGSTGAGGTGAAAAYRYSDAPAANEHDGGGLLQEPPLTRWQAFSRDPLMRAAAVNLALIVTWWVRGRGRRARLHPGGWRGRRGRGAVPPFRPFPH